MNIRTPSSKLYYYIFHEFWSFSDFFSLVFIIIRKTLLELGSHKPNSKSDCFWEIENDGENSVPENQILRGIFFFRNR